jgi:hypothetical protein
MVVYAKVLFVDEPFKRPWALSGQNVKSSVSTGVTRSGA